MKKENLLLGVLGGLGPMSTFRFCELLTSHTRAFSDADHIDMIVSSRATTPDRTDFILGKSKNDPLPVMQRELRRLESAEVDLVVIPCNTAHYFYQGLQKECRVPIINIIEETVAFLKKGSVRRIGLLATEGTVRSGAYAEACQKAGIECIVPSLDEQEIISNIIYQSVKQNRPADLQAFFTVARSLQEKGCEKLVLGCTELSLLDLSKAPKDLFLDSLDVLAYKTILACQKTPVGFEAKNALFCDEVNV